MQRSIKILLLILGVNIMVSNCYSATISYQQLESIHKQCVLDKNIDIKFVVDTVSVSGLAPIFFVGEPGKTQLLISSSTKTVPVLGYVQNMSHGISPQLKEILFTYEEYIDFVEHNEEIEDHREYLSIPVDINIIVSPLLFKDGHMVAWGQKLNNSNSPDGVHIYNKFCPLADDGPNGHALVGCGAVAAAQLMWYWEWPYGSIISNELSSYDWDNMPAALYNTSSMTTTNNIAQLLYDVAKASGTNFGGTGSSSSTLSARNALANEFSYHAQLRLKSSYNPSNWAQMLKDNLNDGHPFLYRGQQTLIGDGHIFVIDGYAYSPSLNLHYYHINPGWLGDSYWLTFDELTDGVSYFDYHYYQEGIFDIYPDPNCTSYTKTPTRPVTQSSDCILTYAGTITLGRINIPSATHAEYYSGTTICLQTGFHAYAGSNVHLAIKDVPCGSNSNASMSQDNELEVSSSPSRIQQKKLLDSTIFSVSPNPATNSITISGLSEDATYSIYNLTGEKVRETAETTIDISAFPAGMYVVIATADGKTYQSKFIKE